MAKSSLPVQTLSQQKENISRDKFSQVVHPWIARGWYKDDYGIDVGVEITVANPNLNSKQDRNVTANFFNVQLKASELKRGGKNGRTFSVPIVKVNYWFCSNVPTLLCLFDTNEEQFYYRWIDKSLIDELDKNNSKWTTQENVSIGLLPNFQKSFLEIEKYVLNKKRPLTHGIKAGDYFAFNKEILGFLDNIEQEAKNHDSLFLRKEIDLIRKDLSGAIYNITIAGESRVGKSSLMNSLIGKAVSPVRIFSTTGVPICATPSPKENCIVTFRKGRDKKGKIDAEFIRAYVDQEQNPDNEKGVELVVLNVVNPLFENGIALYDIPGLNDADPNIRCTSDLILNKSNAVIYVISAAPMKFGEFILHKNMVETLQKLKRDCERVFLVLSKSDLLNKGELIKLEERLLSQLKKHDIFFDETEPFLFLSTLDKPKNKKYISSVNDLQRSVWNFLLFNEKSGIQRLYGGTNNMLITLDKILNINRIALSNTEEMKEMRIDFENVQKELVEQKSEIGVYAKELKRTIGERFKEDKVLFVNHLRTYLQKIPDDQPLYSEEAINTYLEESASGTAQWIENVFHEKMSKIESKYNSWVHDKLNIHLNEKHDKSIEQNTYNDLTWNIKSHLSVRTTGNILTQLLESVGQFVLGVGEVIDTIIKGKELKREKRIAKICSASNKKLNRIFKNFDNTISWKFRRSAKEILKKIDQRTAIYLGNIENSLNKNNPSMNSVEINNLTKFSSSLTEYKKTVGSLKARIIEKLPFYPE